MKTKYLIVLAAGVFTSLTVSGFKNLNLPQASPFLDGEYKMELIIGSKVFQDSFTLRGRNQPIGGFHAFEFVVGEFRVPNVFTVPLTGTADCTIYFERCLLGFDILAVESGRKFKVKFKAKMKPAEYRKFMKGAPAIFTGVALFEDGQKMGEFTAVQTEFRNPK